MEFTWTTYEEAKSQNGSSPNGLVSLSEVRNDRGGRSRPRLCDGRDSAGHVGEGGADDGTEKPWLVSRPRVPVGDATARLCYPERQLAEL
jgi:hypothetical protein